MTLPVVAVVNDSVRLARADVAAALPALQTHVSRDLAPAWGADSVIFTPPPGTPPRSAWTVYLRDRLDDAVRGRHLCDRTPFAEVSLEACERDGVPWTVALSHEVGEMLVNPWLQRAVQTGPGDLYQCEPYNPCRGQTYGVGGVLVQNFALPSWFRRDATPPYDHLGLLRRPLDVAPGGYAMRVRLGDLRWEIASVDSTE